MTESIMTAIMTDNRLFSVLRGGSRDLRVTLRVFPKSREEMN